MKIPRLIAMVLWITPIVIQSIIVIIMLRRRLAAVFPVFFAYTVLIPARETLLLFIRHRPAMSSRIYWWGEAAAVLLGLGIIYEVARHLVQPYPSIRRLALRFFWIVAIVALTSGLIMFLSADVPNQPDPIFEAIILLERSGRFLQACLLIVLILLMSRLGLTWHYYAIGIALGFGAYSAADLALLEVRAKLHLIANDTFTLLEPAAYNVAVLIWALYFVPSRQRKVMVGSLPNTEIARWNEVLSEYLKK
jgi:hypothetical protein